MSARGGSGILAYTLARLACSALGGALAFWLSTLLLGRGVLTGPNNLLYLTVLGALLGYLVSGSVARSAARAYLRLREALSEIAPEAVLAAGTGATLALLITVLLNNVLAAVPGFTWYWSLLIAVLLVSASSWFFVANRKLFSLARPIAPPGAPQPSREPSPKVIDTSAIIDGRLVEIIDANFLDGRLLVPRFVLGEIQHIADADDPLRRKRGRRGLEVLDRLVASSGVQTEVIDDSVEEAAEVDAKLVLLCQERGANLITTDYNLARVAAFQGVRVLNVNELANAVKATFLPGERLSLSVVKEGREPGQGLAYLEDGTMVVIEDAAERVGRSVDVVVTSSLQTNMGRMIFARPERDVAASD